MWPEYKDKSILTKIQEGLTWFNQSSLLHKMKKNKLLIT